MSDVGEIIGRLRLDASDFMRGLEEAKAAADSLDGTDPRIRVQVDGASKAVGELEAVKVAEDRVTGSSTAVSRAQTDVRDAFGRTTTGAKDAAAAADKVDTANKRVEKSSKDAAAGTQQQANALGVLIQVGIAAAPALIPVAAATVGLAGGFAGLGAAAILAGTGIARGLKDGSVAASGYRPIVNALLGDVHTLQDTAMTGLLPGAEASVARLQTAMPGLNGEVAYFAGLLGQIAPEAVDAVVTALQRADPLFQAGGQMLARWVTGLDQAAHSTQFSDFIAFAIRSLPQVEQLLGDALHLATDLLANLAPYSGLMLSVADGVLKVADAVTPLAPAIWATWVAFTAWKAAGPISDMLRGKLALLGTEAVATGDKVAAAEAVASKSAGGGAGGGAAGYAGLVGPLGLVAAVGGFVGAASTGINQGNGNEITLPQVSSKKANALVSSINAGGLYGNGISSLANMPSWLRDFYSGAGGDAMRMTLPGNIFGGSTINNAKNLKTADAGLAGMYTSGDAKQMAQAKADFAALTAEAKKQGVSVSALKALFPQYTAAVDTSGGAVAKTTTKLDAMATAWQVTSGAVNLSTDAAMKNETTMNAAGDAIAAAGQQFATAAKATKNHRTTLDEDTAAGRANREALDGALSAINAHAVALNSDGKHAAQATTYTYEQIASLKEQAAKAGISKGAVNDLISALMHIPKSVVSKITANTADALAKVAAVRERMRELNGVTSDVYVNLIASGVSNSTAAQINRNYQLLGGHAYGGTVMPDVPGHADGGTVYGAGTSTSDSVLRRLSVGEEIISNARGQAAAFRPLLKSINNGTVQTPAQLAQAASAAAGQPQTVITNNRTVAPEIHVHNPVAVDPVQQAIEAAQLALAYAGIA